MIPLTLYSIGWWDQMQKSLHFEIWSEIQWFQHRWKLAKGFWIIKLWLLWEAHWSQQWAWEISSQEQQEASSSQACHSISSKENRSLCKSTVSFLLLVLQRHILVHIFMINLLFIFFIYVKYSPFHYPFPVMKATVWNYLHLQSNMLHLDAVRLYWTYGIWNLNESMTLQCLCSDQLCI